MGFSQINGDGSVKNFSFYVITPILSDLGEDCHGALGSRSHYMELAVPALRLWNTVG